MNEQANDKCWLCLRITPKDIAKAIHLLPFPENKKHKILEEAIGYVEKAYKDNPIFFCSKSAYRIIGGLLYCLSYKYGVDKAQLGEPWHVETTLKHITQRVIAERLKSAFGKERKDGTEQTIRSGYQDWVKLLPELHPEEQISQRM